MATQVVNPPQHKEVDQLTPEERSIWLKEGSDSLPLLEEKKDEKVSPVKKDGEQAPSTPVKESAGSGPAKKEKTSDEKETEKELNFKALREKNERIEAELEEYRTGKRKADSATVAPAEVKETQPAAGLPKEPEKPKRPKLSEHVKDGNLDTASYETAMDKYDVEIEKYPALKAAYDRSKADFEAQEKTSKERTTKIHEAWKTIAEKGRAAYGKEWDSKAFAPDLPIMQHDPVERYLRDSEPEVAAHLLQHLANDRKELERIIGLSSHKQFKELEALEIKLRDKLELGGEPTAVEKKPEKKLTGAGKPPSEPAGGGSSPEDDGSPDAALQRKDLTPEARGELYRTRMNKRDIDARKARSRGRK